MSRAHYLATETICILFAALCLVGCAATVGSNASAPTAQVKVSIQPVTVSVVVGAQQQFSATLVGTTNTSVTWTATGGTISSAGVYTAGSNTGSYQVMATSVADTSESAEAVVTITAVPPSSGTVTSISKDGITWTFSQAVPVGQFVNGDYYVVGPVTITAIDPAPTTSSPYENGSVKNLPTANSTCHSLGRFVPSLSRKLIPMCTNFK